MNTSVYGGTDAVDGAAAFLDPNAGFPQQAMGFDAGQAFVPEFHWAGQAASQFPGKGLDTLRHSCLTAALANRIAEDDSLDRVVFDQLPDVLEVVWEATARDGGEALSGYPQRV